VAQTTLKSRTAVHSTFSSNSQLKLFLKPFDLFLDIGQINFSLFFHIQKKPKTAPGWVGGGKRVFLDDIQLDLFDLNST
jgi:hypothetical protein